MPSSVYTAADVMGRVLSCWASPAVFTESFPSRDRDRVSVSYTHLTLPTNSLV